jgi:hypothetical protein
MALCSVDLKTSSGDDGIYCTKNVLELEGPLTRPPGKLISEIQHKSPRDGDSIHPFSVCILNLQTPDVVLP